LQDVLNLGFFLILNLFFFLIFLKKISEAAELALKSAYLKFRLNDDGSRIKVTGFLFGFFEIFFSNFLYFYLNFEENFKKKFLKFF